MLLLVCLVEVKLDSWSIAECGFLRILCIFILGSVWSAEIECEVVLLEEDKECVVIHLFADTKNIGSKKNVVVDRGVPPLRWNSQRDIRDQQMAIDLIFDFLRKSD